MAAVARVDIAAGGDVYRAETKRLFNLISECRIRFSSHGTPGGGENSQYLYGQPEVAQQAAFACLNRVLDYMMAQQLPSTPRDFEIFLRNLLAHVMALRLAMDAFFVNDVNGGVDSSTNHFVATPAFEAMKGRICIEIRKTLFLLD